MPHVLTCPLARQQQKATDSLFDRCVGIDGVCASRRNLLPLVRLAILSPSLHAGTLQSSRMVAFYKQHEPFEPKHLLWPLSPQSFSGLREKVRISAHEGKRASSSGGMRTHMSPIGRELKFFHPPWMPSTCGSGKVSPAEITHHTHTHTHSTRKDRREFEAEGCNTGDPHSTCSAPEPCPSHPLAGARMLPRDRSNLVLDLRVAVGFSH